MLPDRREDGCLALAVAENGHLTILAELQSNAVLRRKHGGASARALGGCLHALRLENATDASYDAVPIDDDSTIECRRIAHQLWGELAQWAAHEQSRVQGLNWRDGFLPVTNQMSDHLFRGRHDQ